MSGEVGGGLPGGRRDGTNLKDDIGSTLNKGKGGEELHYRTEFANSDEQNVKWKKFAQSRAEQLSREAGPPSDRGATLDPKRQVPRLVRRPADTGAGGEPGQ